MSTRSSRRSSTSRTACSAKEPPATSRAGSTSNVCVHPVMVRTSQMGRMNEKVGRMRPVMALRSCSGRPVTPARTRIGIAGRAPGHGRGVGEQAHRRRLEGREAEADQERARDGHGRAAPARALQERAEAERDEHGLQALVGGQGRDRLLHDLELARLHGDVVEEDRRDDDPGDAQEAEDEAVERRAAIIDAGIWKTTPRPATPPSACPPRAAIQTRFFSTMRTKNSVRTGSADTRVDSGQDPSGS